MLVCFLSNESCSAGNGSQLPLDLVLYLQKCKTDFFFFFLSTNAKVFTYITLYVCVRNGTAGNLIFALLLLLKSRHSLLMAPEALLEAWPINAQRPSVS